MGRCGRRGQRRRLLDVARRAIDGRTGPGAESGASRIARRALALMPDDESDVRAHLTAMERAGDITAALAGFADYSARLRSMLDTEPALETQRLVERIRKGRAAGGAVADAAPTPGPGAAFGAAPTAAPTAALKPAPRRHS